MREELSAIARANGGFVATSEVTRCGLHRYELANAVREGSLIQIERGLYCTPETWEDEYVVAQHRFARGVFSHDTALYLLGLSDQASESLTMSFPRGYNPTSAKRSGIVAKSSPKGLEDLGLTSALTPYGNRVTCYDAERTLCDMLRGTSSPDVQLLNPAMRSYLTSAARSIPTLQSRARSLGVAKKLNTYLEVLL